MDAEYIDRGANALAAQEQQEALAQLWHTRKNDFAQRVQRCGEQFLCALLPHAAQIPIFG